MFTDLCRVLNVSADLLLGLEYRNYTENNDQEIQNELLKNMRNSLQIVAIIFGIDVVQAFIDSPMVELTAAERMQMSKEGFLLPIVRLQDDLLLEPKEYVVVIYNRVVYREKLEVIDETTLEHIIRTFGQVVRKNYGMLLNRDIVKEMTDNLWVCYPALIDGIIPEKISYCLLQEVLKRFLDRGNYPCICHGSLRVWKVLCTKTQMHQWKRWRSRFAQTWRPRTISRFFMPAGCS